MAITRGTSSGSAPQTTTASYATVFEASANGQVYGMQFRDTGTSSSILLKITQGTKDTAVKETEVRIVGEEDWYNFYSHSGISKVEAKTNAGTPSLEWRPIVSG